MIHDVHEPVEVGITAAIEVASMVRLILVSGALLRPGLGRGDRDHSGARRLKFKARSLTAVPFRSFRVRTPCYSRTRVMWSLLAQLALVSLPAVICWLAPSSARLGLLSSV